MPASTTHNVPYRAIVFDLCPLFADGMERVLNALDGFEVRACTADMHAVVDLVVERQANFVVLDLDAGQPAIKVLEDIKALPESVRCVMTITDGSQPALMAAIRMQADGFLSKRLTAKEFAQQLPRIAAGDMVISDALTNALAETLRNVSYVDEGRDISVLSPREVEVLHCIANGMSNRLISEHLAMSDGTVKVHVKHLLKKLGFSTRVEAALWASENGHRVPIARQK